MDTALHRIEFREGARELVVALLCLVPLFLAVDRGHLALPALALGALDLALHARRGRWAPPRLLAARHALLGPVVMLAVALGGARGEAVLMGVSWAILGISAHGSLRSSLPLLAGGALLALTVRPDLAPRPDTLRVATYNIEHVSTTPQDLAEAMRGLAADVIAVQELIDSYEEKPFDVEGYLARHLGMESVSALLQHSDHGGFGVGLFSRHPITSVERLDLPYVPRSGNPRQALKVRIDVGGREVAIVSAHLDRLPYGTISDNSRQVEALIDWVAREPVVALCGDFNAFPVFPSHGRLESVLTDARTAQRWPSGSWPAPFGVIRMDWIFVRGLTPLSQRVVRSGPSDHFPVVADLALTPPDAAPARWR